MEVLEAQKYVVSVKFNTRFLRHMLPGCCLLQHCREIVQGTAPQEHLVVQSPNPRQSLPTYDWLAAAGITPSTTATYTLSTLTSALKSASGFTPALDCSGTSINQISWYFNLKGSAIDGQFVPIGTGAIPI